MLSSRGSHESQWTNITMTYRESCGFVKPGGRGLQYTCISKTEAAFHVNFGYHQTLQGHICSCLTTSWGPNKRPLISLTSSLQPLTLWKIPLKVLRIVVQFSFNTHPALYTRPRSKDSLFNKDFASFRGNTVLITSAPFHSCVLTTGYYCTWHSSTYHQIMLHTSISIDAPDSAHK